MEQERVKGTQQRGDKDAGVIDDILYAAFVWLNLIVLARQQLWISLSSQPALSLIPVVTVN